MLTKVLKDPFLVRQNKAAGKAENSSRGGAVTLSTKFVIIFNRIVFTFFFFGASFLYTMEYINRLKERAAWREDEKSGKRKKCVRVFCWCCS